MGDWCDGAETLNAWKGANDIPGGKQSSAAAEHSKILTGKLEIADKSERQLRVWEGCETANDKNCHKGRIFLIMKTIWKTGQHIKWCSRGMRRGNLYFNLLELNPSTLFHIPHVLLTNVHFQSFTCRSDASSPHGFRRALRKTANTLDKDQRWTAAYPL